MPKEKSPDDVHDLYHVQVGKPYRGQMVTNIDIEDPVDLPKYPDKVKVRRLIHLDNGIIVLEDTIFDRGEVYDGAGVMLPLADIQFPQLDPKDFKVPTASQKEDPEAKQKKQEELRQKAKELLQKRRPSLVNAEDVDNGDDTKGDDEQQPNDDIMVVHIQTPNGQKLPIQVQPTDTIEDLKQKVQDQHDIPVEHQHLVLNGKPLDDPAATMEDCGIQPGDVIDMPMTVRVQMPDDKIVSLAVTPSDSIQKVKDQLVKEHDVQDNAELTFQHNPLDHPEDTLDDWGIEHGDLLKLLDSNDDITVHVQVLTPNGNKGQKIPIQLSPDSTIDDLQDKLEQDHGIPKKNQLLQYDGNDLEDPSKTLKDIGVEDGDVIDLMPAQIKVQTPDGKIQVVAVDPLTDTVPDLKQRIAEEHGIPAKNQDLSFEGKSLTDNTDTPLKELGISHGDVVDLLDASSLDEEKPSSSSKGLSPEKSNERVRTLSPNSVWVYPTAESAPKHGEPNNLQGIWAVPPGGDAGTEPVEVNIHPLHKEPVGDKKSLHGAYGYINGAKPDANGVVDPANIVFYPPETKEFRPDFEQVGWWSNPNASSETYVSYKWVGADCYYTKTHTVTLMGHTVTFKSEWVE